jgi:predicted RNA-binding Zn ribbon-like protein
MRTVNHAFQAHDIVGGDVALDFVNTVTARDTEPTDWIGSYATLLEWAALTGAFSKKDLSQLTMLARQEPAKAVAALGRTRSLREALCAIFYALIARRSLARDDLAVVDAARLAAAKAAKLVVKSDRLVHVWNVEESGLDLINHMVTVRALAVLEDARLDRLRVCDGHDCGWVFIDTSKNGRRRWCDMATCGNTAKARRHYQRQTR